ncbi:MAG: hypothetical protein IKV35_02355, partial [Clostridia bacterium]|nr:hypothetical protein [Clostridia bacterium]
MKKALSIVLSVAMLMTAMFTLFVVPASAEEAPHTYELLKEEYIAEGAEFVTINDDGTWTIEGGEVALAPNVVYDYTVHYNV